MLTKGAIGNLINRYRAVLKKCHLMNTFGSLAVASMLVLGGAGVAGATDRIIVNETTPTITHDYEFKNLETTESGSAISNSGYLLKVEGTDDNSVQFINNSSSKNGGAIYTNSSKDNKISHATFEKNHTSHAYGGGAIYGIGNLTIENSTFEYNYSVKKDSEGHAITWGNGSKGESLTIKNSTFENNGYAFETSANADGSYGVGVPVLIEGEPIYFTKNLDLNGDGVKTATLWQAEVHGTVAGVNNATINIEDSKFIHNTSKRGGALHLACIGTITGSDKEKMKFERNYSSMQGGAVHLWDSGNLTVNGAVAFTENTAGNGGAIALERGTSTVNFAEDSQVEFTKNEASASGGAIRNCATGTVNFSGDVTFAENRAGGTPNDIHNLGTINVTGGTTTIGGGITGNGKINVQDGTLKFMADEGVTSFSNDNSFTIGNGTADSKATIELASDTTFNKALIGKGISSYDKTNGVLTVEGAHIALGKDVELNVNVESGPAITYGLKNKGALAITGEGSVKLTANSGSILSKYSDVLMDVAEVTIGHNKESIEVGGKGNTYGINQIAGHYDITADKITITGANGGAAVAVNGESRSAVHLRGFKDGLVIQNISDGTDYGYAIASNKNGSNYNRVVIDGEGQIDILGSNRSAIYTSASVAETSIKTSGEGKNVNISTAGITKENADENQRKGATIYASGGITSIEAAKGDINIKTVADRASVASNAELGNRAIGIAAGGTVSLKAGGNVNIDGDITDANDYSPASADTGKLILAGGKLNVTNGTVDGFTGIFEQNGGNTNLTVDNGFFGGTVNVNDGIMLIGEIDTSMAEGRPALALGSALKLKSGNTVNVGINKAKTAATMTFAPGSMLVVDGTANQDGSIIAEGGTVTVAEGAKLHINNAKVGETWITKGFDDADVQGWKDGDLTITTSNVLAKAENAVEKNGNVVVNITAEEASTVFANLIPLNNVNTMMAEGRNDTSEHAPAGIRILSLALEKTAAPNAIDAVNEVSRAAVTAGVQNTSLRIADAASNTVLSHMSLSQHDASSAIHADGVDFWAAPMYGNLYTSGMTTSGSSVRGQFGGLALGADLEAGQFLGGKFRLGAAINGGGGQSETKGTATSTQNDYNFGGLNFYAGWNSGALNVIASVGYGFGNHEVEMGIPVAGVNKAKADIDTSAFTADLRAEYQLKTPYVDILPHAGIRYTALKTDAHDLKVDGSVLNSVQSDTQNIVQFPVGVTLSKDVAFADWNVKPMVDVSVIPAAGDKKATTKVNFSGLDAWDSVNTRVMDSTSWAGTIGVQAEKGNMTFGLNYGVQASSNETDQNIQVKFGWKF